MKKVEVIRKSDDGVQTLGDLSVFDGSELLFSCKTLELTYRDNEKNISCIPVGEYKVKKRWSNKYKDHFHILDVPNRTFILIHPANYYTQLRGCIAVGANHADINSDDYKDVVSSKETMDILLAILPDEFEIIIKQLENKKMKTALIVKQLVKGIRIALPILKKDSKLKRWQKWAVSIGSVLAASGLSFLGLETEIIQAIIEGIIAAL